MSQLLHTGSQTLVYRETDPATGRSVVVKRPAQPTPECLDHLQNEAIALRSAQGPGVVPMLGFDHDAQGPCLRLGWVEGRTLQDVLAAGPMTEKASKALLRALLEVVGGLHRKGLVHADLSAANIIMDAAGKPQLIDFGLARPQGFDRPGLTGTVHYMAPELFDAHPPSIASDLYAVGVLAWQMLTGQLPFDGETSAQVVAAAHRQLRAPVPPNVRVHPKMIRWMDLLLARDPKQRPRFAEQAIKAMPW